MRFVYTSFRETPEVTDASARNCGNTPPEPCSAGGRISPLGEFGSETVWDRPVRHTTAPVHSGRCADPCAGRCPGRIDCGPTEAPGQLGRHRTVGCRACADACRGAVGDERAAHPRREQRHCPRRIHARRRRSPHGREVARAHSARALTRARGTDSRGAVRQRDARASMVVRPGKSCGSASSSSAKRVSRLPSGAGRPAVTNRCPLAPRCQSTASRAERRPVLLSDLEPLATIR